MNADPAHGLRAAEGTGLEGRLLKTGTIPIVAGDRLGNEEGVALAIAEPVDDQPSHAASLAHRLLQRRRFAHLLLQIVHLRDRHGRIASSDDVPPDLLQLCPV